MHSSFKLWDEAAIFSSHREMTIIVTNANQLDDFSLVGDWESKASPEKQFYCRLYLIMFALRASSKANKIKEDKAFLMLIRPVVLA